MEAFEISRSSKDHNLKSDDVASTASAAVNAAAAARSVPVAQERRWLWQSMVESAAASEAAINLFLPFCVCQRTASGSWTPPSAAILCSVVLALNLIGSFFEGFVKSTRLLTQTLRDTRAAHQLVFVTSQSVSSGFLNVVTSFPDIAESGSSVFLGTDSFSLCGLYCAAHMIGGMACYQIGRVAGWRCVQKHWSMTVRACRFWPVLNRSIVFAAVVLVTFRRPERGMGSLPLDLTQPGHPGIGDIRLSYSGDASSLTLPAAIAGLAVGIFMSASGAVTAALLVDVVCRTQARPAARLIANFAATLLVLFVPGGDGDGSFVSLKFATSFCGALSAFSGTVGDVTETSFGTEEENSFGNGLFGGSSIPKGGGHNRSDADGQWHLPYVSAAQNIVAHTGLLLFAIFWDLRDEPAKAPLPPIIIHQHGLPRWVRDPRV